MAQIQIRVDEETDSLRTIDAEIIGRFAVHRQYILHCGLEMFHPNEEYFTVTHVRSGKAIRYFQPRDHAVRLAGELDGLTDRWANVTGESAEQTTQALGEATFKLAKEIAKQYPEIDEDEE